MSTRITRRSVVQTVEKRQYRYETWLHVHKKTLTADEEPDSPLTPVNNEEAFNLKNDLPSEQDEVTPQSDADDESRASPNFVPRRSSRINKGVPPLRYGVDQE